MNRKTRIEGTILLVLLLAALSFLIITCKHEIPGIIKNGTGTGSGNGTGTGTGGTTSSTGNCSPDSIYFVNEILPMINSNCATSGCHDAVSKAEDVVLTNYSNIMGYVKPNNAAESKLYTIIASGKMPPSAPMTTDQKAKIATWINQGAVNNQCSSGCDTANFTYSGAVSVIMNTYCKGCHNAASLGGGIDLSTYTTVKTAALGRLMGTINHSSGFSAMPKGSNKLSDCQIRQVEKWIQAGTLNN